MGLETIALVGLATAVIGTGFSAYQGIRASKAQKKAQKAADQQRRLEEQRQRRQLIREQRIKRARLANIGAQTGTSDSSAVQGGMSSLSAQTGAELGFGSQMSGLSGIISRQTLKANNASMLGSIGSSVANLGGSVFSAAGGFGSLKRPPSPTTVNAAGGGLGASGVGAGTGGLY